MELSAIYGLSSPRVKLRRFTPFFCKPNVRSRQSSNGSIYLNRSVDLFRDFEFMPDGAVPYVMPYHRSIDIDNMVDFRLAEIIRQNLDELDSL